jgi:hypothetical protein
MPTFDILLRGVSLFSCEIVPGHSHDIICPVDFDERRDYQFAVRNRKPDSDYAIQIGTEDSHNDIEAGRDDRSDVIWPSLQPEDEPPRLESSAGSTPIYLLARGNEDADWDVVLVVIVYVRPSKIGPQHYERMLDALRYIAGNLIFDLVSKSTRHIGFDSISRQVSAMPPNSELHRLTTVVRELDKHLRILTNSPSTTIALEPEYARVGFESLFNSELCTKIVAKGIPLRTVGKTDLYMKWNRKVERPSSTENRIILGFLNVLGQCAYRLALRARSQAKLLWAVKPFRVLEDGTTPLFDQEELPRISRLERIEAEALAAQRKIATLTKGPLFTNLSPKYSLQVTPIFRHVQGYNAVFRLMAKYLGSDRWVLEDGYGENVKLTSRLYEHWVFLQIAAALQFCGLKGGVHEGMYEEVAASRFTLDLDKGTVLMYQFPDGQFLRLSCEPFILPRDAAIEKNASVFDSRSPGFRKGFPNPDTLIEFIDASSGQAGPVTHVITVDAKYTARIHPNLWRKTDKYFAIRSTATGDQVMRQLWLVYPAGRGVRPHDDAVLWGEEPLPTRRDEKLRGEIGMAPRLNRGMDSVAEFLSFGAVQFVSGLLTFFKGSNPLWSNAASQFDLGDGE